MALESKPLFHPEVLRQQVRSFSPPKQSAAWQPKLKDWADLIISGRSDGFKETVLLPDFLTDIFCGLLGYTGPAESPDVFTYSRERHIEVDAKVADAVLVGFQKGKEHSAAALVVKGTRYPLGGPIAEQLTRSRARLPPCEAKCEQGINENSHLSPIPAPGDVPYCQL